MGEQEEWAEPNGLLPNGLLLNADPVLQVLDPDRWLIAEERTAELIACIQPNPPSEDRRKAVADYVQRLIMNCFPCQVFTFGSVPLKTYLPDGDIDLTAFSSNQELKETWANQVRDMLETEEKNENAEFCVKEVQYIQAEVKLIKCLVENIVVDISFNQLGGLCTLCFLEEVDNLINQNHLFKRSIILIKAWCYYESRILGAHHGLISTYALETLVLYIFHVFNNSFTGPLEVLYRFLEFFSNFDWDNFCVSLWGPVPVSSLPDVTAEPPRKDGGDLLLSKVFLNACSTVYAVFPTGQETQAQVFTSKHFNVIDPLRVNNNLGRSVSKGNFFRIRSAFAFGAKRLGKLLECPKEKVVDEVNQFFTNTWDRHGKGTRPDAPISEVETVINEKSTGTDLQNWNNINKIEKNFNPAVGPDNKKLLFARTRSSPELTQSHRYGSSHQNVVNNSNNVEAVSDTNSGTHHDEVSSTSGTHEEFVHHHNLPSGHLPFHFSPSFLASMGYNQRIFPTNMPSIDPNITNMPFPHGMVSNYFPGFGLNEENNNSLMENEYWTEQNVGPTSVLSSDEPQDDNLQTPANFSGVNFVPPPWVAGTGSSNRVQQWHSKDNFTPREDNNIEERGFSSHRSRTSSESSWDGGSVKGKKVIPDTSYSKNTESVSDDVQEWDQGSSDSSSIIPIVIGNNNKGRNVDNNNNNSGVIAFYPTGPPVPFLTMLPVYNMDASTSQSGGSDSPKRVDPDILNSDFAAHWQNLQYGRFCQNPILHNSPLMYPNPVMVPPVYLQNRVAWDGPGPGRPGNGNLFTQLMNYGHHMVPVSPVANRPPNVYQRFVDDMPRYRTGTGTYLPNPAPVRERNSSNTRRGSYNYDRNNNDDREGGNWNGPKPRGGSRNQNRNNNNNNNQGGGGGDNKTNMRSENRTDNNNNRSWNSYRQDSYNYQNSNGPGRQHETGPQMYQHQHPHGYNHHHHPHAMPAMNGTTMGFDQLQAQLQAQDGNRGQVAREQHHRYNVGSSTTQMSSPDQPSSPHHQRRI